MAKVKQQQRIVVFGKGGVGKSTFSANLSACFASRGLKVLHIGCDPKGDSTLFLLKDMDDIQTVMSWISNVDNDRAPSRVFNEGRLGIKCVEAGGPEAGIGCGGRGIARVLEYLEKWDVFDGYDFDVVVFDVLGDVVCGGFAAPLRRGFGNKVLIVVAEDEMSYFAANNIAGAVERYRPNGVGLAGLVVNRQGEGDPRLKAENFARLINTRILGVLPRSEDIARARHAGVTAVEFAPDCEFSRVVASIADEVVGLDAGELPHPTPIGRNVFMKFSMDPESFSRASFFSGEGDCCDPATGDGVRAAAKPVKAVERVRENPAGVDAVAKLGGFLGTNTELGGMTLDGVSIGGGGEVALEVSQAGAGRVVLELRPVGAGEPDVAGPNFGVYLIEGRLVKPVAKLLRVVARRLGGLTLGRLREVYEEKERDGVAASGPGYVKPARGVDVAVEKWAMFFADRQFARNSGQMIVYDIPFSQVMHRDVECAYATPPLRRDEFNFYNYPWLPAGVEPPVERVQSGSVSYETGLDEADIILGSREKLKGVLDEAVDGIGDREVLIFNNTCVPVVAGDDVASLVAAAGCRCAAPVMYEGPENSIDLDPYMSFFEKVKGERGFADVEARGNAVNLVGFPDCRGMDELKMLLGGLGVEINFEFLPGIDLSVFARFRGAGLSVFCPDEQFRGIYERVFGDVPVRGITPDAPYGVAATRAWLVAVAEGAGVADAAGRVDEIFDKFADEWGRVAGEASGVRLGFVVGGGSLARLDDAPRNGGLHLPGLLTEMGFGLEFMMFAPAGAARPDERAGVRYFSTRGELGELLRGSGCGAVYSDFYFDDRLAAAGKGQFSRQFFEPGFAGAIRSARRLLDVCGLPFFRRFGGYL